MLGHTKAAGSLRLFVCLCDTTGDMSETLSDPRPKLPCDTQLVLQKGKCKHNSKKNLSPLWLSSLDVHLKFEFS